MTLFTMRFLVNSAVIRNEIDLEHPFSRLTLLVCITMKSSMYARQFRATLFVVLARNCLTSTLDYIAMQMRETNRKKGYWFCFCVFRKDHCAYFISVLFLCILCMHFCFTFVLMCTRFLAYFSVFQFTCNFD